MRMFNVPCLGEWTSTLWNHHVQSYDHIIQTERTEWMQIQLDLVMLQEYINREVRGSQELKEWNQLHILNLCEQESLDRKYILRDWNYIRIWIKRGASMLQEHINLWKEELGLRKRIITEESLSWKDLMRLSFNKRRASTSIRKGNYNLIQEIEAKRRLMSEENAQRRAIQNTEKNQWQKLMDSYLSTMPRTVTLPTPRTPPWKPVGRSLSLDVSSNNTNKISPRNRSVDPNQIIEYVYYNAIQNPILAGAPSLSLRNGSNTNKYIIQNTNKTTSSKLKPLKK
eukprot:NODE_5037_length_1077_cov_33.716981_g4481_i0.p1 GENE.NODE_5037_length_1077_cov_33.716981_g4481_i0~~NODE_5037_length_1077_cov_33.716981_g4481_i0.p1  ORF type:complete len:320 (+),score=70.26 NODE_5037_length_1077_cov_33.716981_g4481_i0:114-962(+)